MILFEHYKKSLNINKLSCLIISIRFEVGERASKLRTFMLVCIGHSPTIVNILPILKAICVVWKKNIGEMEQN